MRELGERVGLIHELAQRRRSEELFDRCGNESDIDKALGGYDLHILLSHSVFDIALESCISLAELVLQKLADTLDSSVSQMVNIVCCAYSVCETYKVVDR